MTTELRAVVSPGGSAGNMHLRAATSRGNTHVARRSFVRDPGERIFETGSDGLAWRVHAGLVRLDTVSSSGTPAIAGLAIAGDLLGCEALLLGAYSYRATALTHCELMPWPEAESPMAGESLLKSLATAQRRAADIIALRGGQAINRVIGFFRLLADRSGKVVLPARQDIAEITNLRVETISRIIKGLERSGVLAEIRIDGVRATRGYSLKFSDAGSGLAGA